MAVSNLNQAIGKAGAITLRKNGVAGVELYSPYANTFNLNITSDTDYAMANGSRAVRFDSNKQGSIEMEFDVFEIKLLAILFGMTDTTGSTNVFAREVEEAPGTTITLGDTPLADSVSVYILEADKVGHASEIVDGDPTNVGEYSIAGSTITLNATDGAKNIVVYYTKASAADVVKWELSANDFPVGYTLDFVTTTKAKYDNSLHNMNVIARNAVPMTDSSVAFSEGTHATINKLVA